MLALIINLWLISFIFLGSIISCLDSTCKNLKNIDDNLESIRKELTIIRSNTNIHNELELISISITRLISVIDKKIK